MKVNELYGANEYDTRFLGMYHDGKAYQLVYWRRNERGGQRRMGNRLEQTFHFVSFNDIGEPACKCVILDLPAIAVDAAMVSMSQIGQFHFVQKGDSVEMSGYLSNRELDAALYFPGRGVEIGFEANINTGKVQWAEIKDSDVMMGGTGQDCMIGQKMGKLYSEALAPFTIKDDGEEFHFFRTGLAFSELRSNGLQNQQKARPTSANKYAVSDRHVFYHNTSSIYVYKVHLSPQNVVELERVTTIRRPKGGQHIVEVKPSPDGRHLMVVTHSGILIYNTSDWSLVKTYQSSPEAKIKNALRFGAWSLDGLTFAVSNTKFIQTWDVDL